MRDSFRHKVDVERFSKSDLGGGCGEKTYNVIHPNEPCLIIEKRGVEEFKHGKKTVVSSHRVFMRFKITDPVHETDRLKWVNPVTSRIIYLEVVRVKNIHALSQEMRLDCLVKDYPKKT